MTTTQRRRLPPRMLRRLILSALLGIALAVAAWYLGMDAPHAIGLGAAVLALTACLSALGEAPDVIWAVPAAPPRPGSRRDVVQLGWSYSSRGGRVSPEGLRALRSVAERTLRLRGLDLEDRAADPQLDLLLGPELLALLRRGSAVAPPRTAQLGAMLDRLEAIARHDDAAPSQPNGGPRARTSAPTSEETPRAR
ncbi:hypothetical protein [Leifsonia sp. fls2-241-R2A-40a]|uniref:hypothetical protein n=1 Tax=Leifsonia sp. fls2-241-R2A-40a TaxID=3040290 RepID=UPI00254A4695|nr:hypothetical protein [Leifsonia sp. fls2-241-R2A-40a]